jgi:quercetin dioxygenase-like cupin family protein
MQIFDINEMVSYPYEERDKNVFYQSQKFKGRIIELPAGGELPPCAMDSYVVFYVIAGKAEIIVNNKKEEIRQGQCMITEPATLSLKTMDCGVKIIGLQIAK